MKDEKDMGREERRNNGMESWEPPQIVDEGQVEARLFSDEPDPWGP